MTARLNWHESLDSNESSGWVYLHLTTTWCNREIRVSIYTAKLERSPICWTELIRDEGDSKFGTFDQIDTLDPYLIKDQTIEWAESELMSPMAYLATSLGVEDIRVEEKRTEADFLPTDKKDEQES